MLINYIADWKTHRGPLQRASKPSILHKNDKINISNPIYTLLIKYSNKPKDLKFYMTKFKGKNARWSELKIALYMSKAKCGHYC